MDVLAHGLYGVTVCSRLGLAGGRAGTGGKRWWREPTVWWALLFGLLPDMVSMWIPFLWHIGSGAQGNFFRYFDGGWLTVYRVMHSLVVALGVSAALFLCCRKLFVVSLAWPLHIVSDAISHVEGRFQTLVLYPFSNWGIDGIAWWKHRWFVWAYWAVLVAAWVGLFVWRRAGRKTMGAGIS